MFGKYQTLFWTEISMNYIPCFGLDGLKTNKQYGSIPPFPLAADINLYISASSVDQGPLALYLLSAIK